MNEDKTSPTVGVIGGMGPAAAIDFMHKVVALTPAERDEQHVHMILDNDPTVPSRQDALLAGGEDPGPAIAAIGQRLEVAGADFLVMVCNTAHAFVGPLQSRVRIPLVSIIDVTVDACRGFKRVGVLATDGCIRSRIYQDAMERNDVECVLPTDAEIVQLTAVIAAVKAGNLGDAVVQGTVQVANALVERGAEAIVVGCTEISLFLEPGTLTVPLLSSTDLLAEYVVTRCSETRQA